MVNAIEMIGLSNAEYFDVNSDIVGDVFRIFVSKPVSGSQEKFPALCVLDGNPFFPIAVGVQRILAWGAEAPNAYVIGIGYPTEQGELAAFMKRGRDYVPTDGGEFGKIASGGQEPGAKNFLRFIVEELKPLLLSRYAIRDDDMTLFGASLGGLFGAWTLLTAPATFRRYILCSPTLGWNNDEVWQWEAACASQHRDIQASVFVSAGGLESPAEARRNAIHLAANNSALRAQIERMIDRFDAHGWPQTDSLAVEFAAKLQARHYAGLEIACQNLPDETHISVTPAVLGRGLRYVYGAWRPRRNESMS